MSSASGHQQPQTQYVGAMVRGVVTDYEPLKNGGMILYGHGLTFTELSETPIHYASALPPSNVVSNVVPMQFGGGGGDLQQSVQQPQLASPMQYGGGGHHQQSLHPQQLASPMSSSGMTTPPVASPSNAPCSSSSFSGATVQHHQLPLVPVAPTYVCKKDKNCFARFFSAEARDNHTRITHDTTGGDHVCPEPGCRKKFTTGTSLSAHKGRHTRQHQQQGKQTTPAKAVDESEDDQDGGIGGRGRAASVAKKQRRGD